MTVTHPRIRIPKNHHRIPHRCPLHKRRHLLQICVARRFIPGLDAGIGIEIDEVNGNAIGDPSPHKCEAFGGEAVILGGLGAGRPFDALEGGPGVVG